MENEVKYDRTSLCTRNFNMLDHIIMWTWGVAWIVVIIMLFFAIWGGLGYTGFKLMMSLAFIGVVSSFYIRAVWVDPNHSTDVTYRKEYSKIID